MRKLYYPILKTRDAELRAMKNLLPTVHDKICPIYELTKSRKTSKVPDGDIHRRMKIIEEIQQGKEFILDLATDDNYINPQIRQLLTPHHGFADWYYFVVENYRKLNIIPTIHIYEDEQGFSQEVTDFVSKISKVKSKLALRLPHDLDEDDIKGYLIPILQAMEVNCNLIVIFDANHLDESMRAEAVNSFVESFNAVDGYSSKIETIVATCSSFPSDVKSSGGHDSAGSFPILEESIFTELRGQFPYVSCGDYASINTEQIEMRGGTFVPRIDIVTEDCNTFFYKRYRRDDGSYPRCAKEMVLDPRYKYANRWWATGEIVKASQNNPGGISPAYWISVRLNYYISMKVELRLKDSQLPEF